MEYTTYNIIMLIAVVFSIVMFLWGITGHEVGGILSACGIFVAIGFKIFSPSESVMIKNEYDHINDKRPECVKDIKDNDFTHISMDCAEEYIEFRKDSVFITKIYNENKKKLNEILKDNGLVTDTNKIDTTVTIDSTNVENKSQSEDSLQR
ncbi:MAG: hypothetical protein J6T10_12100 [Methanobrevibacter sp.]|nr:hypothetical protein [Methanobrevibacter sp.]